VTGNGKVPQNWRSFLRDNDNKTELFHILAENISEMDTLNIVIVAKGEDVVSNQTVNLDAVAHCSHVEADTTFAMDSMCSCTTCNSRGEENPHDRCQ
jgi:hypothetical protein